MIVALPAGIAVAGVALFTTWTAARFDSPTPPAWATRRHARPLVSLVVLCIWMAALLFAGQAFLLFETGKETAAQFAMGVGIAALGGVPALLGLIRSKSAPRPKRR